MRDQNDEIARNERAADRVERHDERTADRVERQDERVADRGTNRTERIDDQLRQQNEWKQFLRDQDDRLITLHGPIITGLARFKRYVLFGLVVALLGVFGALIGMRIQGSELEKVVESNREILVRMAAQQEENCKSRNEEAKSTVTSNTTGRKFFLDMAKQLRADGDVQTAKFIERQLRIIPPVVARPQVNCNFTETLNGG